MDSQHWTRIKELFREALNHPPEDRTAFLEKSCGDAPELRKEVEDLLSSHEESTGFMEPPTGAGLLGDTPQKDLTTTRIGEYLLEEAKVRSGWDWIENHWIWIKGAERRTFDFGIGPPVRVSLHGPREKPRRADRT